MHVFWSALVFMMEKKLKFILHDKLSDLEEYVRPLIFFLQ
jgi:hypothetical protein